LWNLLQPLGYALQRWCDGLRHLTDLLADHLAHHVGATACA
jgi:hypothetical protein